jgi:hypothetical protein
LAGADVGLKADRYKDSVMRYIWVVVEGG